MPLLSILTNQALPGEARQQAVRSLSGTVALALGKPERYVMVSLQHNPDMLFAGSDAPLAFLRLNSIGLPAERTGELSATLCQAVSTQFDIPTERIYIEFCDAERHLWGWDGGTFAD